jgi:hypothetical protein
VALDAHEAVAPGVGQHGLEQGAGLRLAAAALGQRGARRVQPLDQVVTQRLELRNAEQAWPATRRDADVQSGVREARREGLRELPLEPGDLLAQGPPRGLLVDFWQPYGRYAMIEHHNHDGRKSTPRSGTRRK